MWDNKPFYSLSTYYKEKFNKKMYKLALNGGMTCPSRDGLIGTRGCIFCSSGGSGEFTPSPALPISTQLELAKELVQSKNPGGGYIAYFQAFTNTYAPVDHLRKLYLEAIAPDYIEGIAIATRPDCLGSDVLKLLDEINHIKPVFIELGLQTIHKESADFIRRGYELSVFDQAVHNLKALNINITVHMIIGLPGEDKGMMLETASYLASNHIDGIKLSLLHIIKGTDLAHVYENEHFHILSLEEYCDIIVSIIERLPQNIVIHRITGDGKRDMLIEPLWSLNKKNVLNTINKTFATRGTYQGKYYEER